MKILLFSLLAVFSAWAASVASADLATSKIPNSRLALGVKLLLLALGFHALNTWLGGRGGSQSFLNWNFYALWCAHLFWAAVAGLLLWYAEVWPAGDAKFFMLAAAWLPLINPFLKNFPHFLYLGLLVNIFVAAALVAVAGYLAEGFRRAGPSDFFAELSSGVKQRLSELGGEGRKRAWLLPAYLLNLTFLFLLQQVLFAEAGQRLARFLGRPELLFFFLFFLWEKAGAAFRSRKWGYAVTAGYLLYFFAGWFFFRDRLLELVFNSLYNVFRFGLLLFFGRFMLEFLMERKDVLFVGPDELKPGMVLSARTAGTVRNDPVFEGAFEDCFRDGLSQEQVSLLAGWLKKLPVPEPKVEVVKGRPFALWILAGAAITLIFDKNAAQLLK